jgi:membrane protease YdiL (CAAX protease family)
MSSAQPRTGRFRAYLQFVAAVLYYFVARSLAHRGAHGLASEQWTPLVEQAMLVFLLLFGYAGMGFWLDGQGNPVSAQGLPRRKGWTREAGTGIATGWTLAVLCILPLTVFGGIAVAVDLHLAAWAWFLVDAAFFALVALAEEIAFRGYGFQRFTRAVGPFGAAVGFAAFYSIVQTLPHGTPHAAIAVSVALSFLLSAAYLRTKALWLSWGLNFGWKASRALLFGLAVSGVSGHSPVVQGDPMGPFWLTGGGFGLDASWFAFMVLLLALFLVFRITRDLDFIHNAPVIVPGGIPVDLDAAARRQHETAMGPTEPAPPALVQILPITSSQLLPPNELRARQLPASENESQ